MSLLLFHSHSPLPLPCTWWKLKQVRINPMGTRIGVSRRGSFYPIPMVFNANNNKSLKHGVTAFFFNPAQDPLIKEALKEPVAFLGGMFAGILRLDLNEEPLKEWVTRTAEASGITEEETDADGSTTEAAPQEIEIE